MSLWSLEATDYLWQCVHPNAQGQDHPMWLALLGAGRWPGWSADFAFSLKLCHDSNKAEPVARITVLCASSAGAIAAAAALGQEFGSKCCLHLSWGAGRLSRDSLGTVVSRDCEHSSTLQPWETSASLHPVLASLLLPWLWLLFCRIYSRRIHSAKQSPVGQPWCFVKGSGTSRYEKLMPPVTPPSDPLLLTMSGIFPVFLTEFLVAQASPN